MEVVPVKLRELLGTLNLKDSSMAIRSQSDLGRSAGSTTRAYHLEQMKEPHERAAVRFCSKCKCNQVFSTSTWCNACQSVTRKARRAADPAFRANDIAASRKYYRENQARLLADKSRYGKEPMVAERDKARRRERYATDPAFKAKSKERRDRYYAAKPHVFRARDAKRRADMVLATPAWADHEAIKRVYAEAVRMTGATGMRHEVDHFYPIKSRRVSGLHVHDNLRVIPMTENRRKFNKLTDDIV